MTIKRYLSAIAASILMPIIIVMAIFPVRDWFSTTDIVMLQLLWVTLVALRSNRRVAAMTTLISVACTDWFFVTPYFTFHIENIEYVVTFTVMLIVGLVISQLAGQLVSKISDIKHYANNTRCLYELAKGLNNIDEIEAQRAYFIATLEPHLDILLHWQKLQCQAPTHSTQHFAIGDNAQSWGEFTASEHLGEAQRAFLNTAISVLYQAHENTQLRQQSASITVQAQLERAKNALLRSLSHDLRTPLATIMGASSMLADNEIVLSEQVSKEQAHNIYEQSKILNQHFDKVMELSRVNKIGENVCWKTCNILALISDAKARRQEQLNNLDLVLELNQDDSCQGDDTLLEIALANMLENAARYGNGKALLTYSQQHSEQATHYTLTLSNGILPAPPVSHDQGVGLGSVICEVVAQFHQGHFTFAIEADKQLGVARLNWIKNND